MAFTGLHVVCSYAGGNSKAGADGIALLADMVWSETLTTPSVTTKAVPGGEEARTFVLSFVSSVDAWVSFGPAPKPTVNPGKRDFLAAGERLDKFANEGDVVAWIEA